MPKTTLKRRCVSHLGYHVRRPPSERSCGKCNGNGPPLALSGLTTRKHLRPTEASRRAMRSSAQRELEKPFLNNPGSCLSSVSCPFFPLPSPIFASSQPNKPPAVLFCQRSSSLTSHDFLQRSDQPIRFFLPPTWSHLRYHPSNHPRLTSRAAILAQRGTFRLQQPN